MVQRAIQLVASAGCWVQAATTAAQLTRTITKLEWCGILCSVWNMQLHAYNGVQLLLTCCSTRSHVALSLKRADHIRLTQCFLAVGASRQCSTKARVGCTQYSTCADSSGGVLCPSTCSTGEIPPVLQRKVGVGISPILKCI